VTSYAMLFIFGSFCSIKIINIGNAEWANDLICTHIIGLKLHEMVKKNLWNIYDAWCIYVSSYEIQHGETV
jgi:hypothetical protein